MINDFDIMVRAKNKLTDRHRDELEGIFLRLKREVAKHGGFLE